MHKKTVLIFIAYYEPGFKSGGPIRSISNLIKYLGDEIDFKIITQDRDKEDKKPYSYIEINAWNALEKCKVFYASPGLFFFIRTIRLLLLEKYDVVYLNSFFSFHFSILPSFIKKIFRIKKQFIIAPRGEFSPGALDINRFKKSLYIKVTKIIKMHANFSWQATNELEENDIGRVFKAIKIKTASMIPYFEPPSTNSSFIKEGGKLKLIFLSRISPKKNLLGTLKILAKAKGEINYHIYGPIDDMGYWKKCEEIIGSLPKNIQVTYKGAQTPNEVLTIFSNYDLFLFLTYGENYGHVIIESLLAGCPTLLNDATPWGDLEKFNAGKIINLNKENEILKELERWVAMDNDEHITYRKNAQAYAHFKLDLSSILNQYRNLF